MKLITEIQSVVKTKSVEFTVDEAKILLAILGTTPVRVSIQKVNLVTDLNLSETNGHVIINSLYSFGKNNGFTK